MDLLVLLLFLLKVIAILLAIGVLAVMFLLALCLSLGRLDEDE